MNIKFYICLFYALTSVCYADFIYEHYKPHKDFEKYFTKENCSLVMDKYYYINCYSYKHKGSKAVAYSLEDSTLNLPAVKKQPRYKHDLEIPAPYRTYRQDYISGEYGRGEILSNESMNATVHSVDAISLMSNMSPQKYTIIRGVWKKAQQRERRVAKLQGSVQVLNILFYPDESELEYMQNNIAIPKYFIKIIKSSNTQECYVIPNENLLNSDLQFYKVDCKLFI